MKSYIWNTLSEIIKFIERLLADNYKLTEQYGSFFYRAMLEKEVKLAQIPPNSKILHIGSGSLPLTAIYLARLGHYVDCVDNDQRAVAKSLKIVKRLSLADKIRVINCEGEEIKQSGYDAVWVSLNILNKELVVRRICENSDSKTVVVIREPVKWLHLFYHATDLPNESAGYYQSGYCTNILSKKSVAIRKRHPDINVLFGQAKENTVKLFPARGCKQCFLSSLDIGNSCLIIGVPHNCLLPSLGVREGKTLYVGAKGLADGPLVVRVDNRLVAIDRALADKIVVGL